MRIVGLTGGIGSGKTTIASMFRELGVPVYLADPEARKLMASSPVIKEKIVAAFGEAAYANGMPDNKFLAAIVFKKKEKLRQLNAIIHPEVQKHFSEWCKQQKAPYVLKEAAILFESGSYKDCDTIVTVTAPEALRIQRVMERDNATEAMVRARIKNQWPEERKIALSDFVIENTALTKAAEMVKKIHRTLVKNSPGK